mmetsp:Transcript_60169/g.169752  ORF Transcript_60169/g.169752 Transcript_60169/m.169752 type:complete len:357 (+) Transcript_60169:104-1174(+)
MGEDGAGEVRRLTCSQVEFDDVARVPVSLARNTGVCRWHLALAAGLMGGLAVLSAQRYLHAPSPSSTADVISLHAARLHPTTSSIAADLLDALGGKDIVSVGAPAWHAGTAGTAGAKVIRVACVGDSITYGAFASDSSRSYPGQLQRMLGPKFEVMSFGHCGATLMTCKPPGTRQSYRETVEFNNSLLSEPDIVVIMLGTNDVIEAFWPKHRSDFIPDYSDLIRRYRQLRSRPKVMIATPPPVLIDLVWEGMLKDAINGELQGMIETVARMNGLLPAVPVFKAFADHCDLDSPNCSWITGHGDGCHPSDRGYLQIAREMYEAIAKSRGSPPAARFTRPRPVNHYLSARTQSTIRLK